MSQRQGITTTPQLVARGFSLVELVVAAAIIAMVGAGTLAAIAFFEQTTVDSSNQKAAKNLLTNVIDQAHSTFTEDLEEFNSDINDGNDSLDATSRGITANAYINPVLGDADRFSGQNPECAIESADLTNKTFTLDSDCPLSVYSGLDVLNSISEPAPIHIIGAQSICAVHRVTSASRTFHLCPDSDACDDVTASTDCIPVDSGSVVVGSEVLIPRYLIRESETSNTGDPISYLVESAGVTGPSQVTLVVEDNYYDSFENTEFTDACAGGTCRVPVQENVSRSINPDRKIRVESDSLAAYSQNITLTVTASELDGDPALGRLTVTTGDDFLADSDSNDHILTIQGTLITLNETLETLAFTGNSGVFEDIDINVAMSFGSLQQTTGSDAEDVAGDIRLEVFPNCGCETEGLTAVTFRLGKWSDSLGEFIDQPSDGLPLDITTVALQRSESHSTFYGYGQSCIGMSGTCTGSTKQQTIAEDDAIALFLYEYTDDAATALNKFSMFFFDDAYNNNCAVTEAESGSSTWNAIQTGVGTWDDDVNQPDGTLVRWGCYAEIEMQNIPQRTPNNPFIKPESAGGEGGDFATTATYTGNSLDATVASWGRINTDSANGGRSDGFILNLPVATADSGLDTYTVNGNPRFIVNEYNSLQSWRIRSIRQPSDYTDGNCPATLPDEQSDEMAWLDRGDNSKVAIPQHLWDSSLSNNTNELIWSNSTNAVELRVQTAKTCPNPAIFN